jgi:glycosyltransferase involved in cell wall biosynthesis
MPTSGPVVLFAAGLAGDGVARNTVSLANALGRRNATVEVICLESGALAADLRGPTVTFLGRGRGPRALALASAAHALHRRLKALQPSVVVSMGNHAHLAVWVALRGLPDIPRIYRISNDLDHGGREPLRRRIRELGLRLVAADATRVVAVSSALAALDPFRRARRDRRVDVLPNGVDLSRIRAWAEDGVRHPWLDDGRPFLVAVGRLHGQKNYETLIDALGIARAADPTLRLLVLGAAPPERRAALEARARAVGVDEVVRFEGEVANPFPFMVRASAYVLPSLWEGASNSLLEALACGAPVVASRTAGNAAEVLAGGRYGVLADPRSPGDLARAILAQARPETCIPVGDRAWHFQAEAMMARFCGIVASARTQHDEIQMLAERSGHLGGPGDGLRGTNTEY